MQISNVSLNKLVIHISTCQGQLILAADYVQTHRLLQALGRIVSGRLGLHLTESLVCVRSLLWRMEHRLPFLLGTAPWYGHGSYAQASSGSK